MEQTGALSWYPPISRQATSLSNQVWHRGCWRETGTDAAGCYRLQQNLHDGKHHQEVNRPTLVLAHNKTLAAQLCSEFKAFFPNNAVEYFVSYYDYYQPEAYIANTDTYIEKDSAINDEIEKLRHSATSALSERRDVIIVASVSCIYSLGDPIDYRNMVISLRTGMQKERDELTRKLVDLQYERNDINFTRNKFGCGATWWRFSRPTAARRRFGWNFSGTRLTASPKSTPSPER